MSRRRYNVETIKQIVDGENPFFQSGYTGKKKKRKEGDQWTDFKGVSWKKVNGSIVRVNKQADTIREMIQQKCSVCGQRIDFSCDRLDHKVFPKTGKCFDCLQVEEIVLRVHQPLWDAYEKKKMTSNKLGALKDFREKVMEAIDFLKNDTGVMGDVLSTGEMITFTGKSNPQWLIDAESDLIKVNDEIKKVEGELSKLEETLCQTNQT